MDVSEIKDKKIKFEPSIPPAAIELNTFGLFVYTTVRITTAINRDEAKTSTPNTMNG